MKPYQRRYVILLLVSVVLHVLLYLLFLLLPKEESKKKVEQTFQVTLRETPEIEQTPTQVNVEQPPLVEEKTEEPIIETPQPEKLTEEEPVKEPEQEPSPVDNADETSTNNQDETLKGEVIGGGQISKEKGSDSAKQMSVEQDIDSPAMLIDKVDIAELKKTEALKQSEQVQKEEHRQEILTSKNTQALEQSKEFIPSYLESIEIDPEVAQKQGQIEPSYLEVISGVKEEIGDSFEDTTVDSAIDLGMPGNILMLADGQLSEVTVPQPFSDKKSDELKLVNKYIKRMNKQVMSYWINPYQGNQILMGIIKIELNAQGYLVNSYVYRESGDKILDISVLDAIRAVRKFKVPDNAIITERYYQNLKFHYSSIEQEVELMPFETESSTKQEN